MGVPTSRPVPDFLTAALPATGETVVSEVKAAERTAVPAVAVAAAVAAAGAGVGAIGAGVGAVGAVAYEAVKGVGAVGAARGYRPGANQPDSAQDVVGDNPTALELAEALRTALESL